jgi:ADP-heptose:LPS heptosyltransferase
LLRRSPWFDRVEIDARPSWWNVPALLRLRQQLRGFDRVYDLQTSARSSRYFPLAGKPEWSGIAKGCALPHANTLRDYMHTLERQREQLEMAGISAFPMPSLDWLPKAEPVAPRPYALLVPGAAPTRPRKRWPVEGYAALAAALAAEGVTPVVIGSASETDLGAQIPGAVDLTGRTTIENLFGIAAGAALAVGNDTGPMHIAAAMGCPSVVLFSADSDPALTAPRGPAGEWPAILRVADLRALPAGEVIARALEVVRG